MESDLDLEMELEDGLFEVKAFEVETEGLANRYTSSMPNICLTLLKNKAPGTASTVQRNTYKRYLATKSSFFARPSSRGPREPYRESRCLSHKTCKTTRTICSGLTLRDRPHPGRSYVMSDKQRCTWTILYTKDPHLSLSSRTLSTSR